MTSILTNSAAVTALNTLRAISGSLEKAQNQASSGYRIAAASDSAAYWSIATTMRSDTKAHVAVTDSLALAQAIVDVAYPAAEIVVNSLVELRNLAIQARNLPATFPGGETFTFPGANGKRVIDNFEPNWKEKYAGTTLAKLDTAAAQQLHAARSAMESASFNGVNLLIKPDNGKSLQDSIASFVVGYDSGKIHTLDLKGSDYTLLNDGRSVADMSQDGHLDGLTTWMVSNGSGGMVQTWEGNWTLFTARQGGSYNNVRPEGIMFELDLGMSNQTYLGFDRHQAYNAWINNLSKQIEKVTTVMSGLGAVKDSLARYEELNKDKIDVTKRGIGRLVDVDMDEVSTRIKALEMQQQLGIQALSIANSSPDSIVQLFR